ncbi:protein-L-isoaspartate(D-aspartate) O-methyltransferase [Pseudanabaena sp. PCC 6802]|uniref:protein-L-isoaspartate(D-aspartate) O-methyltransferase n=1 Tax=Pseudanabaena sp. PCC 6802 TaxID=118173 RepID=UPI000349B512|nr:protein-L-isoaspartate(D-aspartate) O-methyltransferase [Pseudanabaena sp. PCC 6802]
MHVSLVIFLCIVLVILPAWAMMQFPMLAGTHAHGAGIDEFHSQRLHMVDRQLRSRGIQNAAVLKAMSEVPRHYFVNPSETHLAYEDYPLEIGYAQTISQPYVVAYMTEAAEISPNDKVLEIGTGSGYQAAVLSRLAKEVYTVEIVPALAEHARQILERLGYQNVHVKMGNGYEGWPEYAPYDAIVATAAPDRVPPALVEQLAVDGKLVIPVGTWEQDIVTIARTNNGLVEKRTIPVRFVPMTGKPSHLPSITGQAQARH